MTLEDQILALCAEAEPLRCLPDEEAEARGLPALVDEINRLVAMRDDRRAFIQGVYENHMTREKQEVVDALVNATREAKRRGRPPKAAA